MIRNQTMTAMAHRKQRDETLARREDMEFVFGPIGFGMHIGKQERLLEGLARKAQAEPMTDRAMRAVGGDHVRRAQGLGMAVRATQRRLNAGGTLREHHQFNAAFDRHAERREMLRQQTFGHGLIEKQQIRIARVQRIEIEARETHAIGKKIGDARAMTEFEKRLDQPVLFKQFERARLNADGPRIRVRLQRFVDQTHGDVGTRQTHRRGEPGRTRPDDQHRRRIVCGSVHAELRRQQDVLVYAADNPLNGALHQSWG